MVSDSDLGNQMLLYCAVIIIRICGNRSLEVQMPDHLTIIISISDDVRASFSFVRRTSVAIGRAPYLLT